ncbi:hypothetical protein BC937DRAFT_87167 [Endogone sp. FLAS-F59071]|nr:hypothetical protein BC937DRAFT_87167 [Endogone sp. FLAS-F59071]RUS19642.1 hypothetical protein BC937DRAFT_87167 [Endogone sp. FLAS-F59071]|eukprot:RUS19641.1 hypothetical protein BC937DRAFT_87167 [Endogone sp. FLAS-F59071]
MFFEQTVIKSPTLSSELYSDPSTPQYAAFPSPDSQTSVDQQINHLVFVIHGIGQQTEQYGHFHEHIEEVRETTRAVLQAKWPNKDIRIELIPIEWHKALHDQVDPSMNKITLKSIPTIRLIENEYMADVLYYFSKERGQSIIDHITGLFNTSYRNFADRYPHFDGRIVIFGYSLGGICVYDMLSQQRTGLTEEEKNEYTKINLKVPGLVFKPDFFFALGSPIGAVLVMRNQSPLLYHPMEDIHFENIFHPFDPLAYRYEPLCYHDYTDEPAVLVDKCIPIMGSFTFPSFPSFPDLMSANGLLASLSLPSLSLQFLELPKMPSLLQDKNDEDDASPSASKGRLRQMSIFEQARETCARQLNAVMQYMSGSKTGMLVDTEAQRQRTLEYLTGGPSLKRRKSDSDIHSTSLGQGWGKTLVQGEQGTPAHFLGRTVEPFLQKGLDTSVIGETPTEVAAWRHATLFTSGIITSQPLNAERGSDYFSQKPHLATAAAAAARHRHRVEVLNNDAVLISSSRKARPERQYSDNLKHARTEESVPRRKIGLEPMTEDAEEEEEDDEFHDAKEEMESHASHHHRHHPGSGNPSSLAKLGPPGGFSPTSSRHRRHSLDGYTSPIQSESNNRLAPKRKHNDVMVDLNKELHEPGPAITEPGETTAEVVEDATVPRAGSPSSPGGDSIKMTREQDTKDGENGQSNEDDKSKQKSLPLPYRIDYVLQPESFMDMIANEYLVGFRAHFSYWTNKDLLWHVLRKMESMESEKDEEEEDKGSVDLIQDAVQSR